MGYNGRPYIPKIDFATYTRIKGPGEHFHRLGKNDSRAQNDVRQIASYL